MPPKFDITLKAEFIPQIFQVRALGAIPADNGPDPEPLFDDGQRFYKSPDIF